MNQPAGRQWDNSPDRDPTAEEPDHWFRPVWEDLEDETEASAPRPLSRFPPRPQTPKAAGGTEENLLGPLAAAQDALARLDAMAELISPDLRAGLIARLSYTEAAGLLAARGGFFHALDLALRDAERIGRPDLYARSQPAAVTAIGRQSATAADGDHSPWLEMDEKVRGALHLARLLRHLPAGDDPMATTEAAQARLGPLGQASAPFDADRLARWRIAHWPDGRRRNEKPPLLRAAEAAAFWMESGIADRPDAAQALAVAALLLRRAGTLTTIPLPVWAGWTALCAPQDSAALPRLRSDVAARLAPDGAPWPIAFLHLAAEAARAGLRALARLRQAEANGTALIVRQQHRHSCRASALALLLRHPALTAPSLARHLAITPQAALRILSQFVAAGVAAEITGRRSFRAFAIVGG
jgi:hypothetical protein